MTDKPNEKPMKYRFNLNKLNDVVELALLNFFILHPVGWIEINLNYALISIEKLMTPCSDRGNFKLLATHDIRHPDKCYIDYQDGFPRYYFNFDCMIKELKDFIHARPILEVVDIICVYDENRDSLKDYLINGY